MNKKLLMIVILLILSFITGCASSEASGNKEEQTIKIGVTGGVPEAVTNIVKDEAKKEGINLEVITFNDWITPNRSLDNEEIDLNMFQTKQFLGQYVKDHTAPFVALGSTYYSSFGIHSEKHKHVDEIPDDATLGIVNDPINQWRSLLLYEEAGLIKVKRTDGLLTLQDIEANPKNLTFKEIEGPLMVRTLSSIDAGLVSNSYVIDQGLDPTEEAIYLESGNEFPMVVAAKEKDKDNPDYKRITELYHSDAVKQFIEERYKDAITLTDDPFQLDEEGM
ncbi:D-methionine transport system substrate-binding protein [Virgibacillus natechei]|uniref:D-methionine transport system substrate-binding protein n=1 Tax=Virgibacillus natechei TaxID=1216297 RepID=A0ABS4IK85_9BACI|nr:MetQ/NlpA family ABC transporter substrate-binding protein [Virgibacillus natechei]MBP1971373.1 D-methionine transport system substrate-binding protein [Virgibacillus natechei]UZD12253.1 MetQ/NlpA family ABC transporter substrate-binding protein [Virgibacillus natechei]